MVRYLLLCLLGISALSSAVAREAIIKGNKTSIHDFPYQVVLLLDQVIRCGGGIIDPLHILTAAHCVYLSNGKFFDGEMLIIAGSSNIENPDRSEEVAEVRKVFVPKEFKVGNKNINGDIAVLKLSAPLDMKNNEHLKHLELPTKEHAHYTDKTAKIAGFGWNWIAKQTDHFGNIRRVGDNNHTQLLYAKAHVLNDKDCEAGWKHKKLDFDKEFCARVKPHKDGKFYGVCTGDSGGPLVLDGKTVIGVLSQGPNPCTEETIAPLYTRVVHYLSFIDHARHNRKHDDIITHVFSV